VHAALGLRAASTASQRANDATRSASSGRSGSATPARERCVSAACELPSLAMERAPGASASNSVSTSANTSDLPSTGVAARPSVESRCARAISGATYAGVKAGTNS
jgi:hypothetical protein